MGQLKKSVRVLPMLILTIGLVASFQNCGQGVDFSAIPTQVSVASLSDEDIDSQVDTSPSVVPVDFSKCLSFTELHGDRVNVPAKSANGQCYYIRMMSAQSVRASGSQAESLALDVKARPHSRVGNNPHPYVLGEKMLNELRLNSPWKVALSAKFNDPNAPMEIDNFFLLEQLTEAHSFRTWAYGTADAEPVNGSILYADQPIDQFYSYAPGGTARVTAIDLTRAVPPDLKMALRFRGLDCGSSAQASDVFLVFH